ncbi:response regulator [Tianweitania sediminis]|uniref:Response regulator n=1 Tax=Tianweitania sediminis TaxID=1502156 RepID=A0A8J7RJ23_9HYPH|nr:response regulator [Tianweitania sediminis]MBP0438156.1 response regulator [Tianweitania sediminis]HEV7417109.1 response regulator [Tianweitania sediminis]
MADKALAGKRVLLLEDEFLIALDVEHICRDEGCAEVLVFRALAEITEDVITADAVDVAVIDVMIDGGATFDLAHRLRDRNIPFVFATGLSQREEAFQAFEDVPVVTKPYAAPQLVAALRSAMKASEPSSETAPAS